MFDNFCYNLLEKISIIKETIMEKIWNEAKHYWVEHKKVVIAIGVIIVIAIII